MRAIAIASFALVVLAACEPSSGKAELETVAPPTTAHPVDGSPIPLDSGSNDTVAPVASVLTTPDGRIDAGSGSSSCVESTTRSGMPCGILDKQCNYADGVSCACEREACSTPAGPTPNCTRAPVWSCRNDGCPKLLRGACAKEGKTCMNDDGFCAYESVCLNGKWKQTNRGPGCRPAARPHQ